MSHAKAPLRQSASLRPERVNLRADVPVGAELRPERVQLQARFDAIVAEPNWVVVDDVEIGSAALVGAFVRPPKEHTASLIYLLTDTAPQFGVTPTVEFTGEFAAVTFHAPNEELSEEALGFVNLVQALFPKDERLAMSDTE